MKEQIIKLQADVTALKNAEQGAITLLKGLKDSLDAGIEAANAGDLNALKDLSAALETSTDDLAKAVVENTPAAATDAGKTEGAE